MFNRANLFKLLVNAALVIAAVLGARYGIPIPPPVVNAPPPVDPSAPPADMPTKPKRQPNTLAAIGMIQFGSAGCTATIIGDRHEDGRYLVLTANHCVQGKPQRGTMKLRDGRTFSIAVVRTDPRADCCWCQTEPTTEEYPFALLAPRTPDPGTRLWHAGFGIDQPGNRESGELLDGPNADGQVRMSISVSSGDSGGAICTEAGGLVVSCVCCTSARGRKADTWGASPEAIRRAMPTAVVMDDWQPIDVPLRMGP